MLRIDKHWAPPPALLLIFITEQKDAHLALIGGHGLGIKQQGQVSRRVTVGRTSVLNQPDNIVPYTRSMYMLALIIGLLLVG